MPAKKAAAKKAATSPAPTAKKATAKKAAVKAARRAAPKTAAKKAATPTLPRPDGEDLAIAAARVAEDIKAEEILVLDVSEVSSITDYFVLCSGTSTPHLKAIARDLREKLSETHQVKPRKPDGGTDSHWIVLDYGIVIVHAFHPDKRSFYALEDLWGDAKKVDWRA